MPKLLEVLKCEVCGNIVETVHAGGGTLVCCDAPMKLFVENTTDAAREKHVPVIAQTADGVTVTVGSVQHPMEDKHYIEWIELLADGKLYRQQLKPGDVPTATFCVKATTLAAREYCNLHGLWKKEGV